jgi:hypothetical protein
MPVLASKRAATLTGLLPEIGAMTKVAVPQRQVAAYHVNLRAAARPVLPARRGLSGCVKTWHRMETLPPTPSPASTATAPRRAHRGRSRWCLTTASAAAFSSCKACCSSAVGIGIFSCKLPMSLPRVAGSMRLESFANLSCACCQKATRSATDAGTRIEPRPAICFWLTSPSARRVSTMLACSRCRPWWRNRTNMVVAQWQGHLTCTNKLHYSAVTPWTRLRGARATRQQSSNTLTGKPPAHLRAIAARMARPWWKRLAG